MVHVLLKPRLEKFEHYFTSVWDECNCVVELSLALPFCGTGMKTDIFQSYGHCWVPQICWLIECSTFTASSFRIWSNSTGIPSSPLALFIVMHSKAHLTSHFRMSGSRWVTTPLWFSYFMANKGGQCGNSDRFLPEASVRNPARDKVMRKEADIRKACSDFRDPSGNS